MTNPTEKGRYLVIFQKPAGDGHCWEDRQVLEWNGEYWTDDQGNTIAEARMMQWHEVKEVSK